MRPLAPAGDRPAVAPPPTTAAWDRLRGEVSLRPADGGGFDDASAAWPAGARRRLSLRLRNDGPARWLASRRGPGGVAFQLSVVAGGRDLEAARPWMALPRDLAPGEEVALTLDLRRPPGPARLRVEPVILDGWSGNAVSRPGAPCWEGELA
jgi:hypothetical protein